MSTLSVYTLGRFGVARDETTIPDNAWVTQKTKTLFKILLTYHGRGVTKEQLMEWLWRDLEPDAAGRNLRVAISQLRRALEPNLPRGSHSNYILTTDSGYAWNTQADCWSDAEEFQTRCAEFETDAKTATGERARALYRGDYLGEDRYADWAAVKRERLREMYFTLLTRLAEAYARQGRYRRAVALCREVLAADRCRESVWCQTMLYYYHGGDQALALRAYEECRQVLTEELGVEPLPETSDLAEQIRHRAVTSKPTYPSPAVIERWREPPVSLSTMPFVGRNQEFAALANHWKMARTGHPRMVVIEGEAGIGKTRLAQELLNYARQQGTLVLEGKCRELQGKMPYQPIIDALRSTHDAVLVNLAPVWRVELARLVPEWNLPDAVLPADQERGRLFEALTRYLLALVSSQPERRALILFVDDLHWADQTTVEFLAYFGHRSAMHPILLLGTVSSEEVEPSTPLRRCLLDLQRAGLLHRITLQCLTEDALTRLIQEASHSSPNALQLSHRLYRETQGHPLYLVALLQALFEDGVFYVDEQGCWECDAEYLGRDAAGLVIPKAVGDIIQRRIHRPPGYASSQSLGCPGEYPSNSHRGIGWRVGTPLDSRTRLDQGAQLQQACRGHRPGSLRPPRGAAVVRTGSSRSGGSR